MLLEKKNEKLESYFENFLSKTEKGVKYKNCLKRMTKEEVLPHNQEVVDLKQFQHKSRKQKHLPLEKKTVGHLLQRKNVKNWNIWLSFVQGIIRIQNFLI